MGNPFHVEIPRVPGGLFLLDLSGVQNIVPAAESTIKQWVKQGKFPKPVKVGSRSFWRKDEVWAWAKALHNHKNSAERATMAAADAISEADKRELEWLKSMGLDHLDWSAPLNERLNIPTFAELDAALAPEIAALEDRIYNWKARCAPVAVEPAPAAAAQFTPMEERAAQLFGSDYYDDFEVSEPGAVAVAPAHVNPEPEWEKGPLHDF